MDRKNIIIEIFAWLQIIIGALLTLSLVSNIIYLFLNFSQTESSLYIYITRLFQGVLGGGFYLTLGLLLKKRKKIAWYISMMLLSVPLVIGIAVLFYPGLAGSLEKIFFNNFLVPYFIFTLFPSLFLVVPMAFLKIGPFIYVILSSILWGVLFSTRSKFVQKQPLNNDNHE